MTRFAQLHFLLCGAVLIFGAGLPCAGQTQTPGHIAASQIDVKQFDELVAPFVAKHCVRCHNEETHEAERRFDSMNKSVRSTEDLVDLQDILDQLNLGTMPPKDQSQPSNEVRAQVIDHLTNTIEAYRQSAQHNPALRLRRLSSREYRNSVADLFRLNMTMFDPTHAFPKEQTVDHLDNTSHLVTSGFLLQRYLDAADSIVRRILDQKAKPTEENWRFTDNFRQQPEIDQVHKHTTKFKHLTLYDVRGADKHEGAYGPIHAFATGVPHDGVYEIRFSASAFNRLHPYDDSFLRRDRSEPLRLGIVAGFDEAGPLHLPQPTEPTLSELDLADGVAEYTVRVWMDRGCTPRFTFENGLMDSRSLWSRLIKKYPSHFKKGLRGIVEFRRNAIEFGKLPQIHVDDISIRGPIHEQWPTKPQLALLGPGAERILDNQQFASPDELKSGLERIAAAAYRRPVYEADIAPLQQLVRQRISLGRSQLDAFGDAVKSVLCSPNFLLLYTAPDAETHDRLASRLSYFLWSSCPDDELLAAARNDSLSTASTRRQQIERLLQDARSERFVADFTDAWLNLRELGSTPPDRNQFGEYYQFDLRSAMHKESQMFFAHMLNMNMPLHSFINSEFTFANKRLAALYEIPFEGPNNFKKVSLPTPRRGGLLGQASVLTVSANGIDTSPVVRGIWVLENLLASPPAPPPPDVEPLDPDTRGSKSIRDQLAKHRSNESCNNCHQKIDPLGFALENYDPIGGWRTNYDKKHPVDASGILPGGRAYKDIVEFKSHLLDSQQEFYRGFVTKLLAYASGRPTSPLDLPDIERLTAFALSEGAGLRDIVVEVALTLD